MKTWGLVAGALILTTISCAAEQQPMRVAPPAGPAALPDRRGDTPKNESAANDGERPKPPMAEEPKQELTKTERLVIDQPGDVPLKEYRYDFRKHEMLNMLVRFNVKVDFVVNGNKIPAKSGTTVDARVLVATSPADPAHDNDFISAWKILEVDNDSSLTNAVGPTFYTWFNPSGRVDHKEDGEHAPLSPAELLVVGNIDACLAAMTLTFPEGAIGKNASWSSQRLVEEKGMSGALKAEFQLLQVGGGTLVARQTTSGNAKRAHRSTVNEVAEQDRATQSEASESTSNFKLRVGARIGEGLADESIISSSLFRKGQELLPIESRTTRHCVVTRE
jgi:hypothetical protein